MGKAPGRESLEVPDANNPTAFGITANPEPLVTGVLWEAQGGSGRSMTRSTMFKLKAMGESHFKHKSVDF